MEKFFVTFSADDVNKRTMIVGNSITFIKRDTAPIDEKTEYSKLLREKLSDAVPSHSNFRVTDTLKDVPSKGITKCYVQCEHQIKHAVSYLNVDLQQDKELKFVIKVKCAECLGRVLTSAEAASTSAEIPSSSAAISSTSASSSIPEVSFLAPNDVTDFFKRASAHITEAISRAFNVCISSENPREALFNNKVIFGQALIEAWYNAYHELGQAPSSTLNPVDPIEPEPVNPTPIIQPSVRNANLVLSQAQKRVQEQSVQHSKRKR